jgi:hypothetical protein
VYVAECDCRALACRQIGERGPQRSSQKHNVGCWRLANGLLGFVERVLDSVSEAPSPCGAEAVADSYPAHPGVKSRGVAEPVQAA